MKTFFRIFDNKLYGIQRENIGFSVNDAMYIPDEYLENKKFMVMRTCHGIGDWVLLSGMPRLLKEKYSDCKVYVPSVNLLEKLFTKYHPDLNPWNSKFHNVETVFKNNPFVDDFVDEYDGEIFHDHYRIYDNDDLNVPLVEQMLKFWQFDEKDYEDSQPEMYWSDEE